MRLVWIILWDLVRKSSLNLLVQLLGVRRRWRLDGNFVVQVSMVVTHFFLVIGAAPLPIHDVLVLVLAWRKWMEKAEFVVRARHALHLCALLPVVEGTDDEDFVAAMAPHKDVLHRSLAMGGQRNLNLLLDLSMLLLSLQHRVLVDILLLRCRLATSVLLLWMELHLLLLLLVVLSLGLLFCAEA